MILVIYPGYTGCAITHVRSVRCRLYAQTFNPARIVRGCTQGNKSNFTCHHPKT